MNCYVTIYYGDLQKEGTLKQEILKNLATKLLTMGLQHVHHF